MQKRSFLLTLILVNFCCIFLFVLSMLALLHIASVSIFKAAKTAMLLSFSARSTAVSIKDLNKLIKQAQNAGLTYEQGKNGRCRLVSPTGEFYQLQTNSSIHDQRSLLNTEAGIRRLIKKSGLEPTALSSKAGKHGLVR